jgi:hypothetical protein
MIYLEFPSQIEMAKYFQKPLPYYYNKTQRLFCAPKANL